MSIPATNRPLFHQSSEHILTRALNSMTLACDALTKEKSQLNSQVKDLEAEVTHLKDKLITNRV